MQQKITVAFVAVKDKTTMEMKKYLELGEKKAGKQIDLARTLGIPDSYIRIVKSGRRGLPADVCIKLADFIGADRLEVIAASNLVTEKDEEKRKIFESCFTTAASVIFLLVAVHNFMPFPSETNTSLLAITTLFVLY